MNDVDANDWREAADYNTAMRTAVTINSNKVDCACLCDPIIKLRRSDDPGVRETQSCHLLVGSLGVVLLLLLLLPPLASVLNLLKPKPGWRTNRHHKRQRRQVKNLSQVGAQCLTTEGQGADALSIVGATPSPVAAM